MDDDNDMAMYYLVNTDLKMSAGKMCAQIGHATVSVCLKLPNSSRMKRWLGTGQAKIVLRSTEEEMTELYQSYRSSKDRWCVQTIDAGKTEIPEGVFYRTCVCPEHKRQNERD